MARIFKLTYAKMRTLKGPGGKPLKVEKIASRGPNKGKRIMVAKREPVTRNGKLVLAESRKWYIEYVNADGITRRVPGYTDKRATEQRAAELERIAAYKDVGLIDQHAEHRKRPLTEHLDEWHAALIAKGTTDKQAREVHTRACRVIAGCRFTRWTDLSASKVQAFVADLRKAGKGISIKTGNDHLAAVKQFAKWVVQDGRAPHSPLTHLKGGNAKQDRRYERRPLTTDELGWLIDTTEHAPACRRMTGSDRAMLYRLATGTGFRATEMRSLTPVGFQLDVDPPAVLLRAADSKHRRDDLQPIRPDLAELLRGWLADKPTDGPVF